MQQELDNRVSSIPLEDVFVDTPETGIGSAVTIKHETRLHMPAGKGRLTASGSLRTPHRSPRPSRDPSIQTRERLPSSMQRSSPVTDVNDDMRYVTRRPSRHKPSTRVSSESHDSASTFGLRIIPKSTPLASDISEADFEHEAGAVSPILSANSLRSSASNNPIASPISARRERQRLEPWSPKTNPSSHEPASRRTSGRYSWFYNSVASKLLRTHSTSTASRGKGQKDVIPPSILALDEMRDSSNILSLRQSLLTENGFQITGDQDWETVADSQNLPPLRNPSPISIPSRKPTESSSNNRSSCSSSTYGSGWPYFRSNPPWRKSASSRGRCSHSSFGSNSRRNAISRRYQLHRTTSSSQSIMLPDFKLRSGTFSRVGSLAGPIPRLSATRSRRRRITPPSPASSSFYRQSKPLKPSHRHPFKVTPPMLLLHGLRRGRHFRQKLANRFKFFPRSSPGEDTNDPLLSRQKYDLDNATNCSDDPSTDWWTAPGSKREASISPQFRGKHDIAGKSTLKVMDRPHGQRFDAAEFSDNTSAEASPVCEWYKAVNDTADFDSGSAITRFSHDQSYQERQQSNWRQSPSQPRSPTRRSSSRRLQSPYSSPDSNSTSPRFLSNNPFARLAIEERRESGFGRHTSTFLNNIPERRLSSETNADSGSPPVVNLTIPSTREIGGWRQSMLPAVPPPVRSNRNSIASVTFRQHRRGTLSNDMVRKRLSHIDTSGLSEAATRRASCRMSSSYQQHRSRRLSAMPLKDMRSWARASCSATGVGAWETRRIFLDPRDFQQYSNDGDHNADTINDCPSNAFLNSKEWYSSVNGRYAFPQPPRLVHNGANSRKRQSKYVTELPQWQSSDMATEYPQQQNEISHEMLDSSRYHDTQKRCGRRILFIATLVPIPGWLIVGRIGFGGPSAASCLMRWCSNYEVLWFRREEQALARRMTMLYGLIALVVMIVAPVVTLA